MVNNSNEDKREIIQEDAEPTSLEEEKTEQFEQQGHRKIETEQIKAELKETKVEGQIELEREIKEKKEEKRVEESKKGLAESKKKEEKPRTKFLSSEWYDKNYKILMYISFAITILVILQLVIMQATTGDIMKKDVSLTGGTVITLYTSQEINIEELTLFLESSLKESVTVKRLSDISTGKQIGISIESRANLTDLEKVIEEKLNITLTEENSSKEVISSGLSKSFYKELVTAVVLAFIFMAVVIFILFKKPIPCLAVIQAGFTDAVGALAIANLFKFSISTAGIAALLMLIGYSVDTDVMLTTKVLKRREGQVNQRIKSAFKTGITMTLTSFAAVFLGYFIVNSAVLKEIFFILSAGLFLDLITTWCGNAGILKSYCKRKGIE